MAFAMFGEHLHNQSKKANIDAFHRGQVAHCLALLKRIGEAGLSTRYGLELVVKLFDL